jgi:hypothetical protein
MDELADPWSDERHPDDHATGLIDHDPGPPGVPVGVERRA